MSELKGSMPLGVSVYVSKIVERLITDHQRMYNVLNALESAARESRDGEVSAQDRLFCMVDYLAEYAHDIHHPTEDLAFEELLEKISDPEARSAIEATREQHKTLEVLTHELLRLVEDEACDELVERLHEYRELQNRHMVFEESRVFPALEATLSADDWRELDHLYEKLHDPLFDAEDKRFAALYQHLGVDPEQRSTLGADAVNRFLSATGQVEGS